LIKPPCDLLAERVDADPPRALRVTSIAPVDVDIEYERVFGVSGEPVDVVPMVGNGRELTGLERAVDGRADQEWSL